MPGMNPGVDDTDPLVVAAFRAALAHQGLIALLILLLAVGLWLALRAGGPWLALRAGGRLALRGWGRSGAAPDAGPAGAPSAEPAWRSVLRIGFGILWLLDGALQAQPRMALGMPSQVIEPTAASSPAWVQHVVNWAGTTWSYHPMQAGAAAVWIQVGIGAWLLAVPRGRLSRLAGLASVGWGLVVWVFGESFGGIFAPGLTWLFGAPGAVLLYCAGGALIALPERAWGSQRTGRLLLAGLGVFLIGMAVLQAWPGRGFWQGTVHGRLGTLTGMIAAMATTPQPSLLARTVSAFQTFTAAHGFAVNLAAVVVLAVTGLAFTSGRPRLVRPALAVFVVVCLADWVLIEDLGFLGGVGTDPNSMIPYVLLAVAGYLALTQAAPAQTAAPAPAARPAPPSGLRHPALSGALPGAGFRLAASAAAVGVILLGAAPMAAAQANPVADAILAQAINGYSSPENTPADGFTLTAPGGHRVSLSSLRGKVVLLTFLDPVSVRDSPLIAEEFRQAGQLLAGDAHKVALVAINDNPSYPQLAGIAAFSRQEGLDHVPNWVFLTGTPSQIELLSARYGLPVQPRPAGASVAHLDYAFVIDQRGHLREAFGFSPGPGTQTTRSSFAGELASTASRLLSNP